MSSEHVNIRSLAASGSRSAQAMFFLKSGSSFRLCRSQRLGMLAPRDMARLAFAVISLTGYIFIELAAVLYTGSLAIYSIVGLSLAWGLSILCIDRGGYTIWGGLKSVAYTDIVQVSVLISGGLAVTITGLIEAGGASAGYSANFCRGFDALTR